MLKSFAEFRCYIYIYYLTTEANVTVLLCVFFQYCDVLSWSSCIYSGSLTSFIPLQYIWIIFPRFVRKKIGETKSSSQHIEADGRHNPSASRQGWAMTTMASRGSLVTAIMSGKEWCYKRRTVELIQV